MFSRLRILFRNEAVSYLFWGVAATAVNWIVYTAASFLTSCSMTICNFIAWLAAVLFAYLTNRRFVFHSHICGTANVLREFLLFVSARVFTGLFEIFLPSILFSAGVIWSFVGIEGFWAKAVVTVLIIILNYILSKLVVFRK